MLIRAVIILLPPSSYSSSPLPYYPYKGLFYYSYIFLHEMQFLQKYVRVGRAYGLEREREEKIVHRAEEEMGTRD
jgi:hypothetical protein